MLMRISLRTVLIGLVALVALGGLFSSGIISTVPSEKTTEVRGNWLAGQDFCQENGVTLLIEPGASEPVLSCAKDYVGTGWDLFAAAGQSVSGTSEYPVGFVCRINNYPAPEDQPCTSTPDSKAGSWAYYFASNRTGNHWMFSGVGASMRKPACGDVDAWVFIKAGQSAHPPLTEPQTFKCKK